MPISLTTHCDQDILHCDRACKYLPDVSFNVCAPQTYSGEITKIYLSMPDHPLINETDANELGTRLGLVYENPDRIITLSCKGEKKQPNTIEEEGAYGRKAFGFKTHILDFVISQLSDTNYNMMRKFELKRKVLAWYQTSAGMLYGGKGIPASIYLDQIIPISAKDLETLTGFIEWENKIHPCRQLSPI